MKHTIDASALIEQTEHGQNIANQIQGHDAYGGSGTLTLADIWLILDNLQTHAIHTGQEETAEMLGEFMLTVASKGDIETI